ncbi:hypothetical protein LCGC14_0532100 [marine sediment metagenome]|uniref:Uncharacterized protein n=1 Tax=marine sediment metagenome TaxID=412755 RepID=A0A0F9ATB1_9ZZZZ
MPQSNRSRRKHVRRHLSTRRRARGQATTVVRKALSELPEHIRSQISVKTSTVIDQGLRRGTKVAAAFASVDPEASRPTIYFFTDKKGDLVAPQTKLLPIARHEVAHILPTGKAKHPAIRAAGQGSQDLMSGVQTQHAGKFQQNTRERRRALLHYGAKNKGKSKLPAVR